MTTLQFARAYPICMGHAMGMQLASAMTHSASAVGTQYAFYLCAYHCWSRRQLCLSFMPRVMKPNLCLPFQKYTRCCKGAEQENVDE